MRGSVCRTARRTPYLPVRDLLRQVCGLVEGDEPAVHTAAVQQRLHASGITAADDVALLLPAPGPPGGAGRPGAAQSRGAAGPDLCAPAAPGPGRGAAAAPGPGGGEPALERSHLGRLAGVAGGAAGGGGGAAAGDLSAGVSARLGGARGGDAGRLAALARPGQPDRRAGGAGRRAAPRRRGSRRWWRRRGAIRSFWRSWPGTPWNRAGRTHRGRSRRRSTRCWPRAWTGCRLRRSACSRPPPSLAMRCPCRCYRPLPSCPRRRCMRGLAHLQAAEFLYETRLFPEHVYTFKHALTQEVAYGSLLLERRRVLHAPPCRGP